MKQRLRALCVAMLQLLLPILQQPRAEAAPGASTSVSAELKIYLDAQYRQELREGSDRVTPGARRAGRHGEVFDRSEAALQAQLAWRRRSVAGMQARFDRAVLTEDARDSYDAWALELERAEAEAKWHRHRYIFTRGGPHTSLPNSLINLYRIDDEHAMEDHVARVAHLDDELDQLLVRAKAAAADGIHMPLFAYDQALDEIRRMVSCAPFTPGADCELFADAKAEISKLEAGGSITPEKAGQLTRQLAVAMVREMQPAYDRVAAFLLADKRHAQKPERQGALALPDGAEFYQSVLYLETTTRMTADEIHALGLAEVVRLHAAMERAKVAAGFQGTLAELFNFMRTDRRFFFANDAHGAAEYIKRTEDHLHRLQARLPDYFASLPTIPLVVKRFELFREPSAAGYQYLPGEADGTRPGMLYINLSDMNALATHQLESCAYHEGVPGHHLQRSIQRTLTGVPRFRTWYSYSVYSEGWGMYAEALAKEMGFNTDPYSELGRLTNELWRAIRMVVDTGIHAKGWTQQQAEEYFLANSPQPAAAVKSEIERYILRPGQATTYKIGMIAIQQLRDEARAVLGSKFDYRSFHDAVLGGGELPMPLLEARVRRWVEQQKQTEPRE